MGQKHPCGLAGIDREEETRSSEGRQDLSRARILSGEDGKTLKISFNHPKLSSYTDIEGLEYVLTVSQGETLVHSETGAMKRDNSVEYKDLEHGTKYDIEVINVLLRRRS